jgi:hypothetical protein
MLTIKKLTETLCSTLYVENPEASIETPPNSDGTEKIDQEK